MQLQSGGSGMGQQQHIGQCRVRHIEVDGMAHGHAAAACGNPGQPDTALMSLRQCTQHAHGHIGCVGQGIGQSVIAHLLQQQCPVHIGHAHAAIGFGSGQAHQALFCNLGPQLGAATGRGFPDVAQQLGGCFGHQKAADRVTECDLIFGKGEVHGCLPADQDLGRPSMR